MTSLRTLMLLAVLGQAAPLPAQSIVGLDFLLGDVYAINSKTGQATLIGSTGLDQNLWHAMAKDSQGGIYGGYVDHIGMTGTRIYRINPVTAQASFLVNTGLDVVAAMAFGPGDVLYAVKDRDPQVLGSPDDLYTVDLVTGASTLIGPTGVNEISGLAFGSGCLWAWDSANLGLVKVDTITGLATDVNPSFGGGTWDLSQTLFFSDHGVLYGGFGSLFVIDTVTGVPTYIGYMHGAGFIAGMEFLPNQPPPFALGVMGVSGGPMGAFAAGATPGGNVAFFRASGGGGPTAIPGGNPCAGTLLDLNAGFHFLGLARADAQGRAQIGPRPVPPLVPREWRLQALDLATCRTTNRGTIGF